MNDYLKNVFKDLESRVDIPFLTTHTPHSRYLTQTMIDHSKKCLIFAGDTVRDALCVENGNEQEVINSLLTAAKRGVSIKLAVKDIDKKTATLLRWLLAEVKVAGVIYIYQVNPKTKTQPIPLRFAVMDNSGYRFEAANRKGIANFNDPKTANALIDVFDSSVRIDGARRFFVDEAREDDDMRVIASIASSKVISGLISEIARHPKMVYSITSREFEEVVAELLSDMGCAVRLTPQSRDKGRDILATIQTPVGEILTIVECKRWSIERKIGIETIERFLWCIERTDKASVGLFATTSEFTSGALKLSEDYKWKIKLRDYHALQEWISNYGKWSEVGDAGIWLPRTITRIDETLNT